jgi:hypothetical protein
MTSERSLLVALFSVIVCYFFLVPPTRSPVWPSALTGKPAYAYAGSLAIGISLTANHGTVSIRHDDGSFEDVARVDGGREYLGMMRRMSLPPSSHPAYVSSSSPELY